jgi:hypothetical protein
MPVIVSMPSVPFLTETMHILHKKRNNVVFVQHEMMTKKIAYSRRQVPSQFTYAPNLAAMEAMMSYDGVLLPLFFLKEGIYHWFH